MYRVTAVRAASYASDPGGETLPSDPLNVTLPDLTGMTATPLVKVTLAWPAMPNAASYNIYRTGTAGKGVTEVQLVANVPQPAGSTVTFNDTGATTGAQTPLPIGALGKWNAVSSLTVPRFGAAAAIAHGALTATTDTWFLYVGGGASDVALTQAGLHDSYEWARVDVAVADGSQTVSAFTVGKSGGADASIGGARAFLSAYAADTAVKSEVPVGSTFVYFGAGMDRPATTLAFKSGMVAGSLTAANPSGDLGALATIASAPVGGAGAATIAGSCASALVRTRSGTASTPSLSAWEMPMPIHLSSTRSPSGAAAVGICT